MTDNAQEARQRDGWQILLTYLVAAEIAGTIALAIALAVRGCA